MSTPQPRHIAIVMDGNGRWASLRGLERHAGHRAGIDSVRLCIEESVRRQIEALTLFAFSSENWQRPGAEVEALMNLFVEALDHELPELQRNGVRLKFIGERQRHSALLQSRIAAAEAATQSNTGLKLQIALSYGGRWDVVDAARTLAARCVAGNLRPEQITEEEFAAALQLANLPEPDLLIRTGGEQRLSNFLLWNLAYAELYFCATLWPQFDRVAFEAALESFAGRQRRFGMTGAQVDASA
ncbi:MAG: polyprenyl diphosphate synthase [Pseudomonadota bacterium]